MIPITLYYSVRNHGDGSAYPHWFLTQEGAQADQDLQDEGWGESCTGSLESYERSTTHIEAIDNEKMVTFRQTLTEGPAILNGMSGKILDIESYGITFLEEGHEDIDEQYLTWEEVVTAQCIG